MILVLHRDKSDVRAMTFELLTMDPEKRWKFEDYDSGQTWVVYGQQIREEGLGKSLSRTSRDSRLIFYSAIATNRCDPNS